MLRVSSSCRNVFDPIYMRAVKKTLEKYRKTMNPMGGSPISREAFVDVDDKGPAWYMGHMSLALDKMEARIKHVDFVVEIRDARLPFTTENPNLKKLTMEKPRLIIFNKAELANEECNLAVQRYYESRGSFTLFTSARRTWRDTVETMQRFVTHVVPSNEFKTVASIGLVLGMPNVGKSTLINSLRMAHEYQFRRDDFRGSRTGEAVGTAAGTTRGVNLVPVSKDPKIVLYDTPGITMPGNFAKEAGFKLAACGIVPTNNLTLTDAVVSRYIYDVLVAAGAEEHMAECLHLPRAAVSYDDCISLICERSGFAAQTQMGQRQPAQAQKFLLHDFQSGKLGRVTLDRLPRHVQRELHPDRAEAQRRLGDGAHDGGGHTDSTGNLGDAGPEDGGDSSFVVTHDVQTLDAAANYPEHMRDVMQELHGGAATAAVPQPARSAPSSPKPRAAPGGGAPGVISRRRGVISRVSGSDKDVRDNLRIRKGR